MNCLSCGSPNHTTVQHSAYPLPCQICSRTDVHTHEKQLTNMAVKQHQDLFMKSLMQQTPLFQDAAVYHQALQAYSSSPAQYLQQQQDSHASYLAGLAPAHPKQRSVQIQRCKQCLHSIDVNNMDWHLKNNCPHRSFYELKCKECGKVFYSYTEKEVENYKNHVYAHTAKPVEKKQCPDCLQIFRYNRADFEFHKQKCPWKLPYAPIKPTYNNTSATMMKKLEPFLSKPLIEPIVYTCDICSEKYTEHYIEIDKDLGVQKGNIKLRTCERCTNDINAKPKKLAVGYRVHKTCMPIARTTVRGITPIRILCGIIGFGGLGLWEILKTFLT